jgi:hypothetical protein
MAGIEDKMYPSFLVIGGQKGGTSWLQDNLALHPQVWLPPTKEVHYLDRGNDSLLKRLFGTTKRMKKARAHVRGEFRTWLSGGGSSGLKWALNYWLGTRDDAWYRDLFPSVPNKIAGEICPGYALLRGSEVERVHTLMPEAKIVYMLRNPMERSWSYAAQYFSSPRRKGHYGGADKVPESVLKDFLSEDAKGHSDYLGALEAWQGRFPSDRMLVGYFDELERAPKALFVRVLEFLSIDAGPSSIPPGIGENRNPSRGSKVPPKYRAFLAELHLNKLRALDQRLKSEWTAKWLEEALELAGERQPAVAKAVT